MPPRRPEVFKSIELQVRPRGKPIKSLPDTLTIDTSASASELYGELAKRTKYSIHQLRITKGSDGSVINNVKDTSVHATGVRDQSTIYVKDLGPQISWRTVFIIEYAGPVFIHPIIYALRPYIYSNAPPEGSHLQALTLLLVVGHFVKRELETMFVHRFSASTMPFRNVFKNSFHYWILAGLNIAAWIYSPNAPTAKEPKNLLMFAGLALYALGELGNLQAHLTLMNLRSPGSNERAIPEGWLFDLVTCPNYMTETISWLGVLIVSNFSLSVLVFIVISVGQMMAWAKKKESRYRKEFGDKYKRKRYTMLPGIF
ncbi:3-oxo-5a-steroid 4- dehydrogenase [Knufia obscura]|uniref:3-oxo-5a-steroid 4- dehydrogenase n=1 Tax=Knufia obscura TaxID=1635080 RepID=A0ABR0RUA3_9EURO|nr:3-oxo-5a-steroid 4- dehydrogenase [Knufia obscura]